MPIQGVLWQISSTQSTGTKQLQHTVFCPVTNLMDTIEFSVVEDPKLANQLAPNRGLISKENPRIYFEYFVRCTAGSVFLAIFVLLVCTRAEQSSWEGRRRRCCWCCCWCLEFSCSPSVPQIHTSFAWDMRGSRNAHVEYSLKVATQMARNHASLAPDVDMQLICITLYFVLSIQLTRLS